MLHLNQAKGGRDKLVVRGHHPNCTDTSVLPIPCSIGFELRCTHYRSVLCLFQRDCTSKQASKERRHLSLRES